MMPVVKRQVSFEAVFLPTPALGALGNVLFPWSVKLSRPLAESPDQPYTYANNNPLRFIDPDGMATQTIKDFNGNSHTLGDDEMTTIYQATDNKSKSNVNTSAEYDKLKTGTNVTSGIYSGTKLDEVVIKGKKINTFDQAISTFGSAGYNRRYFPRVANDHNDYGPLRPFALNGFQVQYNLPFGFYGGFVYVSFKGNGSFYTVYNPLQVAGSPSLVAGASPQLASMKEGLSFNLFVGNPLTSNTTLDDFGGWSGSISGQYGLGVGYSRALEFVSSVGRKTQSSPWLSLFPRSVEPLHPLG